MDTENAVVETDEKKEQVFDRFDGPFDAVAYLLMMMRLGMEKANVEGELPRYVRIARAQQVIDQQSTDWIKAPAEWAILGTKGLNFFMAKMITLTLDAKDLLKGSDAIMALTEIALEMTDVLISEDFWNAVGNTFEPITENSGGSTSVAIPSNEVMENFRNPNFDLPKVMERIELWMPDPEDLERIGYELYRMCCLIYGSSNLLSVEDTGKLRLLQYTFKQKWDVYHMTADVETEKLGQMKEVMDFPTSKTLLKYSEENGRSVDLFKAEGSQKDDVTNVLKKLGYTTGEIDSKLRHFQRANDIATTGVLDEATINRFFQLDTESKNLKRAKKKEGDDGNTYPMGFFGLVNGNADDYTSEDLSLSTVEGSKYRFYKLRSEATFPEGGSGWVTKLKTKEDGVQYMPGFVAIESRFVDLSRKKDGSIYEGGSVSEGEAADGRFFFVARHVEPWIPGRNGTPKSTLIYDDAVSAPPKGSVSQMYQEVEIDLMKFFTDFAPEKPINTYTISFEAFCLRRSLYIDRSRSAGYQPDQGRILLDISTETDVKNKPTWKDPQKDNEGWKPSARVNSAILKDSQINQRNNWFRQSSGLRVIKVEDLIDTAGLGMNFGDSTFKAENLKVKKLKFKVMLEGRYRSGWDIDAYFDEVKLKWMFTPKATS